MSVAERSLFTEAQGGVITHEVSRVPFAHLTGIKERGSVNTLKVQQAGVCCLNSLRSRCEASGLCISETGPCRYADCGFTT